MKIKREDIHIIGLLGEKGHGKSTIFNDLQEVFAEDDTISRRAFADPLKEMAAWALTSTNFGGLDQPPTKDVHTLLITDEYTKRQTYYSYLEKFNDSSIDPKTGKPVKEEVRVFIQWLGQYKKFIFGEDYWTNQWGYFAKRLPKVKDLKHLLISDDTRYPIESDFLLENNAVLLRVIRPIDSDDDHSSEVEQRSIKADFEFLNDGSIEDLKSKVLQALPEIKKLINERNN